MTDNVRSSPSALIRWMAVAVNNDCFSNSPLLVPKSVISPRNGYARMESYKQPSTRQLATRPPPFNFIGLSHFELLRSLLQYQNHAAQQPSPTNKRNILLIIYYYGSRKETSWTAL
jgi:hypothetical protein